MATSFGALATDFYVNAKLGVKLDLPTSRETVMDFFQRVQQAQPAMTRVRRFHGELALESAERDGRSSWLALRKTSVRTGSVNPESLREAYELHALMLELAPFYLSVRPLEVDCVEVVFGFDLEAPGNHNQLVWDAFYAASPLAHLASDEDERLIDAQPVVGVALAEPAGAQAFFEIKTRVASRDVRDEGASDQPISVYVTLRRLGPVSDVRDLLHIFKALTRAGEELVQTRAAPHLIAPLREAIASGA